VAPKPTGQVTPVSPWPQYPFGFANVCIRPPVQPDSGAPRL